METNFERLRSLEFNGLFTVLLWNAFKSAKIIFPSRDIEFRLFRVIILYWSGVQVYRCHYFEIMTSLNYNPPKTSLSLNLLVEPDLS